jgi:hypothetical protein
MSCNSVCSCFERAVPNQLRNTLVLAVCRCPSFICKGQEYLYPKFGFKSSGLSTAQLDQYRLEEQFEHNNKATAMLARVVHALTI